MSTFVVYWVQAGGFNYTMELSKEQIAILLGDSQVVELILHEHVYLRDQCGDWFRMPKDESLWWNGPEDYNKE